MFQGRCPGVAGRAHAPLKNPWGRCAPRSASPAAPRPPPAAAARARPPAPPGRGRATAAPTGTPPPGRTRRRCAHVELGADQLPKAWRAAAARPGKHVVAVSCAASFACIPLRIAMPSALASRPAPCHAARSPAAPGTHRARASSCRSASACCCASSPLPRAASSCAASSASRRLLQGGRHGGDACSGSGYCKPGWATPAVLATSRCVCCVCAGPQSSAPQVLLTPQQLPRLLLPQPEPLPQPRRVLLPPRPLRVCTRLLLPRRLPPLLCQLLLPLLMLRRLRRERLRPLAAAAALSHGRERRRPQRRRGRAAGAGGRRVRVAAVAVEAVARRQEEAVDLGLAPDRLRFGRGPRGPAGRGRGLLGPGACGVVARAWVPGVRGVRWGCAGFW